MKKSIVLSLAVVFVFSFYLGTVAAPNLQEAKVNIDYGMKMFLNGQPFNPTDSQDGTAYRPLICKNRIYLPVGIICDAVKVACDYDSTKNALNIGERKDYVEVNAKDFKSSYNTAFTKDANLLFVPNKTYKYGIVKAPINWDTYGAVIKPKGKYSKFKTTLYLSEGKSESITFEFKNTDNNELLKSVTLKAGETVDIEFNIVGVEAFSITHQSSHKGHRIILGEPQFK